MIQKAYGKTSNKQRQRIIKKSTNFTSENITLKVLENIASILESMGKNIKNYGLIDNDININDNVIIFKEIEDELNIIVPEKDLLSIDKLNFDQKHAYNIIVERVFSTKHGSFFIDGPGGTGKTFLYCALLAKFAQKDLLLYLLQALVSLHLIYLLVEPLTQDLNYQLILMITPLAIL